MKKFILPIFLLIIHTAICQQSGNYESFLPSLTNVTQIQFGEWGQKFDVKENIRYFSFKRSIIDKVTIEKILDCIKNQIPTKTKLLIVQSYPVLFLDKSGNVIISLAFDPDSDPDYAFHYCGFKISKEFGFVYNHDPGWSRGGMLIHCKILADIIKNSIIHKGENFGKIPDR